MSLADELNKVIKENETSNFEQTDYPSSHLKQNIIYVNKKNPQVTVRILPRVSADAPTWAGFRQLWVSENGNNHSYIASEDTKDPNDPLIQALNRWSKAKFQYVNDKGQTKSESGLWKVDTKYGKYPSVRYYVNVIPLTQTVNAQGLPVYAEEKDKNGNPLIHIMTLTGTMLRALATKLEDKMQNPNTYHQEQIKQMITSKQLTLTHDQLYEQMDNSFISALFAYPVTITRLNDGNKVSYDLSVKSTEQLMLNPLPQNWTDFAEDLAYQASPSYKWNQHWEQSLIDRVDDELGLTSHIEQPTQQVPAAQGQKQPTSYTQPVSQKSATQIQPQQPQQPPVADPFPEKKVQATAPTSQPNMNGTAKVGVPNTSSKIEYGTEGVYEMGSIYRDGLDDDDTPKNTAKDASVAQAFPTTPKNIDSIPADDMPKDDANEDLESQVDEILGGLDDDSAGLLKD